MRTRQIGRVRFSLSLPFEFEVWFWMRVAIVVMFVVDYVLSLVLMI